ncbi:MAG TPA: type IV toxin-antitoxin system AbiEi family antitoxin domain-containing protein [Solirubrobacterales bacterium]|nr:type IV toxin-antitoxin system AbiEi family antitoxin domain-containing protein [Solirubrobacterales bacterium]
MAEIARRQHGVVGRRQVEGLGLSGNSIDRLVRIGRLHRVHLGVYAVGHDAVTRRGRWMAAVLASGDGAVLSHRSAAALWEVWGSGTGEAHVTVPRKTRSQRSIRRHFSVLPVDEVTVRDGIPVTSAARTVLDLAAERGAAAAESALREMEYLRIYEAVSLPVLLGRYPRHKGAPIVAFCLRRLREDPGGRVRSTLEELFLPFLDAHRIPRPRLNAWISIDDDRFQVDCLWSEAKLIGELDGFKSHGTRRAFRKDRRRDRRLGAHGFHVVRITEDQLLAEAVEVARDLKTLIYNRP